MRCIVAFLGLRYALAGSCGLRSTGIVFADQHDGDEKIIKINDSSLLIEPYANNESWIIVSRLDPITCNATIDFNVPGKPSPPPVNLTATIYTLTQSSLPDTLAVGFTDPTATIAASPQYPVNFWVQVS